MLVASPVGDVQTAIEIPHPCSVGSVAFWAGEPILVPWSLHDRDVMARSRWGLHDSQHQCPWSTIGRVATGATLRLVGSRRRSRTPSRPRGRKDIDKSRTYFGGTCFCVRAIDDPETNRFRPLPMQVLSVGCPEQKIAADADELEARVAGENSAIDAEFPERCRGRGVPPTLRSTTPSRRFRGEVRHLSMRFSARSMPTRPPTNPAKDH